MKAKFSTLIARNIGVAVLLAAVPILLISATTHSAQAQLPTVQVRKFVNSAGCEVTETYFEGRLISS
jgi:uncharacterized membrane protein YqgA involved in biofilm formation